MLDISKKEGLEKANLLAKLLANSEIDCSNGKRSGSIHPDDLAYQSFLLAKPELERAGHISIKSDSYCYLYTDTFPPIIWELAKLPENQPLLRIIPNQDCKTVW